jgi:hypothetical protein
MAKTDTALDEDLLDGLQQAKKKKPRHFAMITKGPDVVGLIVQKKKILEGQVQKAKKEFKGNQIIQGVCQGQGVELTFEVVGEEPSIKPIKIKEFIGERTELTVKPSWAVVPALTEVTEVEEDGSAEAPPAAPPPPVASQPAVPPVAPPAPPADGDPLAALAVKMKQLTPAVQAAIVANPARKGELLAPVSAFQNQVKAKDAAGAQQSLVAIAKLVKDLSAAAATSAAPPVAPPAPPPTAKSQAAPVAPPPPTAKSETPPEAPDPQYTKAKAKFAASRGTWIKVRDQAVTNIRTIRDAMFAQFKDDPDLKENLARGMKELDDVASRFNDELKNKFDEFTADPPPPATDRERIKREALALIDAYRGEIESNSIYEDLDQREFAQVLVKAPLLKVLAGMAKDLA